MIEVYFIFALMMEGESRQVPQIYGPMTEEHCEASKLWAESYAKSLSDIGLRKVYLLSECMTTDKLKLKSI